jgi:DNA-binding HxlR family transcriptional regulator
MPIRISCLLTWFYGYVSEPRQSGGYQSVPGIALHADCQARLALDLLANTWNGVLIWALRGGPLRHGELRTRVGGISAKVLTETLRRLEYHGLVAHRGGHYELTTLGTSLLGPIEQLGRWSYDHAEDVLAAQQRAEALADRQWNGRPADRPELADQQV